MKVTIVNYGIGNILSVQRAFEHVGADVTLTDNPADIARADRIVVPGVGAFKKCMDAAQHYHLIDALKAFAASGKPYLGICVGMQMLLDKSYEFGEHAGLGLIAGDVRRIDAPGERVPFIGWKPITLHGQTYTCYFVHSYQAVVRETQHQLATYHYGSEQITAAVGRDNVLGLQFHPEKSGKDGLAIIRHFLSL